MLSNQYLNLKPRFKMPYVLLVEQHFYHVIM